MLWAFCKTTFIIRQVVQLSKIEIIGSLTILNHFKVLFKYSVTCFLNYEIDFVVEEKNLSFDPKALPEDNFPFDHKFVNGSVLLIINSGGNQKVTLLIRSKHKDVHDR